MLPFYSVQLLSLVFEMARRSTTYMLQLVQMKAFELISLLLERVITFDTVIIIIISILCGRYHLVISQKSSLCACSTLSGKSLFCESPIVSDECMVAC